MKTPILIGFHALKTGGKDTTYNMVSDIAETNAKTARKRGFADYGKLSFARQFFPDIQMAEAIEFCDEFKVSGSVRISWGLGDYYSFTEFEGREPIAHLLTEGGRNLHGEDVWVDLLLPRGYTDPDMGGTTYPHWWEEFEVYDDEGPDVADICGVTDLRFVNEAERIKEFGGYLVKINREEATQRVWDEAERKGWGKPHASELGLPDELFDFILDNNSNFDHLRGQVEEMMEVIGVREKRKELHYD